MQIPKPICFVVMPFSAEMHYFYLYVKKHIEERHNLLCERADDRVATSPISEKVRTMIQKADVILADCTGRNPNVFYEVGLAHAFERKTILITRDAAEPVPTDVRQFEFIKYDPGAHVAFLDRLDGALDGIFEQRYDREFEAAEKYFDQFISSCPTARRGSRDVFAARYRAADGAGEVITPTRLLTFVIQNVTDPDVMARIVEFEPPVEQAKVAAPTPSPAEQSAIAAATEQRGIAGQEDSKQV
jgi:hypothetical protein